VTEAVVFPDGRLIFEGHVFRAALGRGGVRVHKQEGDGATPAGLLPLRRVLFRADRVKPPVCAVPREPLAPEDGWCDAPDDIAYNRPVTLPYSGRHEELWRRDGLYDVIGVLGWNDAPVRRGEGSAIFLHVARPDFAPTEGCVALPLQDLLELLKAGVTGLEVKEGLLF
jgi:L,D-peptidoglycan transpeptidase YkuD (ErfK/YbiS/YcfS/YnhG family)